MCSPLSDLRLSQCRFVLCSEARLCSGYLFGSSIGPHSFGLLFAELVSFCFPAALSYFVLPPSVKLTFVRFTYITATSCVVYCLKLSPEPLVPKLLQTPRCTYSGPQQCTLTCVESTGWIVVEKFKYREIFLLFFFVSTKHHHVSLHHMFLTALNHNELPTRVDQSTLQNKDKRK